MERKIFAAVTMVMMLIGVAVESQSALLDCATNCDPNRGPIFTLCASLCASPRGSVYRCTQNCAKNIVKDFISTNSTLDPIQVVNIVADCYNSICNK